MLESFPDGSAERERLEARITAPSLWDAFVGLLARSEYSIPASSLGKWTSQRVGTDSDVQDALIRVYREDASACARVGASLLVDAYHSVNLVPFSVSKMGLERAFVVGGGYKYCQFGEGVCFLRIPPDCSMRAVLTG